MQKSPKNRYIRSVLASESGITLIDAAIVMVIIGLLTIPIVQGLRLMKKQSAVQNTETSFYTTAQALENFYTLNGYYPCPADPTLGPKDEKYGEANVIVPAAGGGGNTGGKDGGNDLGGGGAAGNNDCVIPAGTSVETVEGALPFKALKMTAKEALDGWNNKIAYAVTTELTKKSTFKENKGKIRIYDKRAICMTSTPITRENYHFVFFSLGENGAGAYNAEGNLVATCPGSGTMEHDNCNRDQNYLYPLCLKNDHPGNGYYDDLFYRNAGSYYRLPSKMWKRDENVNDIRSDNLYVGVNNFEAEHELDVNGNIMVQAFDGDDEKKGQSHANKFCNADGTLCTKPEMIAGSWLPMQCGDGKGMAGIGSNRAKCSNSTTAMPPQTCPLGQFVIGIDNNGQFTCGGN